ncbi:DUF5605 domain-containing protein [Bacillus sp. 3255]|uniref:DUF5605 domain-containing protein n=1 Tax=Bacillus sp. 3255 TaxID=2817904 RepID=UPI0028639EBE|nr:DUF5060 domain-containing protein [Bacillus sp. 3255]MDR6880859.1 hypothetical protein [Bacillus sp. 3255]
MLVGQLQESVERWGIYELSLRGPENGNPFKDNQLQAIFRHKNRSVRIQGFYDGEGVYRIRFMPDTIGEWAFETESDAAELNGKVGSFVCTPPAKGNHGPVRVHDEFHFVYEDGERYLPFGTTSYAWIHQTNELQQETLETLAQSPFNKIRMCVFPKNYSYNATEPDVFPFVGDSKENFDHTRFEPAFFHKLERHLTSLQKLGIEADLILFHPYDKGRWGFDSLDAETDAYYLRYVVARLASFRNVWWSLANEYDFMREKQMDDWDRLFRILQEEDPYQHLRSIHNGTRMYDPSSIIMYDHGKPWVTHCSIQHWDLSFTQEWSKLYRKPVIVDECCYEGNVQHRWGNLTAEEMVRRCWDGVARGGYVTHGETYVHPEMIIWWAKGGKLYGDSPSRIAFLRSVLEQAPIDLRPLPVRDVPTIGIDGHYYLYYFGIHRPAHRVIDLPEDGQFMIEWMDTWEMSVTRLEGVFSGKTEIALPGKTYIAVRITRV